MSALEKETSLGPSRIISNVPDGMQPVVLARLVEERLREAGDAPASVVFVARDGRRLQRMAETLQALMPGHQILSVPAWDCLPYDRVSPNAVTIAQRMTALSALADPATRGARLSGERTVRTSGGIVDQGPGRRRPFGLPRRGHRCLPVHRRHRHRRRVQRW